LTQVAHWNILSNMESTSHFDASEQLGLVRAADEATYAPRPIPRWYTPVISTALALYLASMGASNRDLKAIAVVVYGLIVGISIGVMYRKQGRMPKMRKMPVELRRHTVRNVAILIGVIAAAFAVVSMTSLKHPWFWLAGAAFILMNIAGPIMERSYRRAYADWVATK
jgi:hypothetical protein